MNHLHTLLKLTGKVLFVLAVLIFGAWLYGPVFVHPDSTSQPTTTVIHTDKSAAPDGLTEAQREEYYATLELANDPRY